MNKKFDFSAVATAYDVKCSDGLTILKGSFSHQDGETVPMVYQHNHKDIDNVIGHCLLKEEDKGMRLYAYLNPEVEAGKKAKSLIQHGDIKAVSIYANGLQKDPTRTYVKHGNIKEVSIVLAGANPGAVIDFVALEHSDGSVDISEEEGTIFNGDNIDNVSHSEEIENEEDAKEIKNEEDTKENETEHKEDTKDKETEIEHKEDTKDKETEIEHKENTKEKEEENKEDTKDVIELNEEQSELLEKLISNINENNLSDKDKKELKSKYDSFPKNVQDTISFIIGSMSDKKENLGGKNMGTISQSVFDNENQNVISHEEVKEIFSDARKCGSLKEAILSHAVTYGIDGVEKLFPDFQLVEDPSTIKRDDGFVSVVMNGVKKVPFAKIRSMAFNITAPEARAKGYVKGDRKVEEIITALKRETTPQTVYKKQKMDRDDMIDITSFDVVAYLKKELQDMLKEELARAILIGDGRLPDDSDKIKESNIRPILSDDDAYTIKTIANISTTAKNKDIADEIIEVTLKARKNYKGSGNPYFFCSSDYLTSMLLAQDTIGRRVYNNETELASALRVSSIVECPVMEGATYSYGGKVYDVIAIIANLKDYTIGADKKGEINMFDDFDINYNQMIYLIETRISGALTKPYSAIAVLREQVTTAG